MILIVLLLKNGLCMEGNNSTLNFATIMMKNIGAWLVSMFVLSSCEKAINFTPHNAAPLPVVEATIENDQYPVVFLSRSLNYFSTISPGELDSSFIHGADITLSNGAITNHLIEYAQNVSNGYTIYYYSTDTNNPSSIITGEFGKAYSLQIITGGKTYTATTTIPLLTKKLDSLWWIKSPNNPDTGKVVLMGKFTDPPGYGNYIRYFTKTNSEPFYPGLNSVFDDQIVDGTTYSIQIEKGVNRNEKIDQENFSFFKRGDTATVKFCNIDKATFDFWRTMEYSYSSIGNPFSTPTKVLSNINGGGLGYFGGYAAQYKTIIIPK